jgi:hypothetical protein
LPKAGIQVLKDLKQIPVEFIFKGLIGDRKDTAKDMNDGQKCCVMLARESGHP